ncbi:MAG: FAD-dependent oxidoreductase [Bacteroidia bacterium]|nr:FAD-dependent oxidoreductase [Bacteroidia bacterium]
MKDKNILIIGAGFAGLAAAIELIQNNISFTIIEKSPAVGGLSQTIEIDGVRFELGPHIYFDKDIDVLQFWQKLAGVQMESYTRNNAIFYKGKYIKSPLDPWNAFINLGPFKIAYLLTGFLFAKLKPRQIVSAEDWVKANFGTPLYENFFKVYNEKIWGLSCADISPNWAGQRIKSSLLTMIYKSLKRDKDFIIKTFLFPKGGSQSVYNSQLNKIKAFEKADLFLNQSISQITETSSGFIVNFSGNNCKEFTDIISTIHLEDLYNVLKSEKINYDVLRSSIEQLVYRNLLLVNLVFLKNDIQNFKYHWIDIHDPNVRALRVTNFGNYDFGLSLESKVGIGVEYNCFKEDNIWNMNDSEIIEIALSDLAYMNLTKKTPIKASVLRLSKAYPVYFKNYEAHVATIMNEFSKVKGLYLIGRNGMYKWNNMHHSVKTGILAVRNILGEQNDLFAVKGMVAIGKESD